MSKPSPRDLTVIKKGYVTPNMLRVTLGGDGMAGFPEDQESAYVKLIFPIDGDDKDRVLRRTYTVRHDRMVGRILEHERVVSREGQDVREAPIGRQCRAAFAGVEVHEKVCTFFRS